ncbi:hypothetical protein [Bartonella sp. AA9NXGY]|uniref:hypothetical protein n=1 Tax=Bartonella sp. AA9NXGY TaxID=3243443 RepID=UPI0035D11FE4
MPIPSQVLRAVATVRLGKEKDRANLTEMKERGGKERGGKERGGGIFFGGGQFQKPFVRHFRD